MTDYSMPPPHTTGTPGTDASVGELLGEVASDLSRLMRQELELAKAELKAEASKAGKGAGLLGGAGFAGYMFLVLASFAAVFGIGTQIALGWAFLIIAVIWAIVGAVLAVTGRTQLRRVNPKPQQTIETVKEDAQWARHPTR